MKEIIKIIVEINKIKSEKTTIQKTNETKRRFFTEINKIDKLLTRLTKIKENRNQSYSQDGGIGGNPSLPHTTKRRIKTNLKLINNQKH